MLPPLRALQPGDVLVMGSDGLFDNLWEEDLEEIVEARMEVGFMGAMRRTALRPTSLEASKAHRGRTRWTWSTEPAAGRALTGLQQQHGHRVMGVLGAGQKAMVGRAAMWLWCSRPLACTG